MTRKFAASGRTSVRPIRLHRRGGRRIHYIPAMPDSDAISGQFYTKLAIGLPQAFAVQSTSAGSFVESPMMQTRREQLIEARYVRPSRLFLRFADGYSGTWTFSRLKLNMTNMDLATIRAADTGTAVEVKSKWGDNVQLDSSSLRVLIDPDYAAEIEKTLNELASRIGL